MSGWTASFLFRRTSCWIACFWTVLFLSTVGWVSCSCLIQVWGSFGSPSQPNAAARNTDPTIHRRMRMGPPRLLLCFALTLNREIEVVVPGDCCRVHHLFQNLEVDVLVCLNDGRSVEGLVRVNHLVVVLQGDEVVVQLRDLPVGGIRLLEILGLRLGLPVEGDDIARHADDRRALQVLPVD